jgi:hypothetical protein
VKGGKSNKKHGGSKPSSRKTGSNLRGSGRRQKVFGTGARIAGGGDLLGAVGGAAQNPKPCPCSLLPPCGDGLLADTHLSLFFFFCSNGV